MDMKKLLAKMKELDQPAKKESSADERFYTPKVDEAGNATVRIRFLPNKSADDLPFAKIYTHGFKNANNRWFIENCHTTIGKECPVCASNSEYWNKGDEASKNVSRGRKRQLNYFSNILVVEDKANPENEGKVFIYRYGKKIYDKIMAAMQPEEEDQDAINPFDPVDGADLRLKICQVAGFRNYDKSVFLKPSEVAGAVLEQLYDLNEFTSPENFKSYDDVKEKFEKWLDSGNGSNIRSDQKAEQQTDNEFMRQAEEVLKQSKKAAESKKTASAEPDDDDAAFFAKLAND